MEAQAAPATAAPVTETPAAAPAVEVAAPAAPEVKAEQEAKQDPKFAARFAALSRKEAAIREQQQAIKAKEAEFKAWQETTKTLEENPLKYLQEKGWTFDKLTQLALNDGKKPAEMRIQELEEKISREKREAEESSQKAQEAELERKRTAFMENVKGFLESNKEKYELTANETEGPELIHNVMWQYFEQHNRRLSMDEAAGIVEKHFEDLIENKYAKLNKVQAKFRPKEPAATSAPAAAARPASTLTNTQAATVPTPSTNKALDVEASKLLAAKLLKWN